MVSSVNTLEIQALKYEISDSVTKSFIVKQDDQGLLKSQKEYERSFIPKKLVLN